MRPELWKAAVLALALFGAAPAQAVVVAHDVRLGIAEPENRRNPKRASRSEPGALNFFSDDVDETLFCLGTPCASFYLADKTSSGAFGASISTSSDSGSDGDRDSASARGTARLHSRLGIETGSTHPVEAVLRLAVDGDIYRPLQSYSGEGSLGVALTALGAGAPSFEGHTRMFTLFPQSERVGERWIARPSTVECGDEHAERPGFGINALDLKCDRGDPEKIAFEATYEASLIFEPGKTYDLFVDLGLRSGDGLTADFTDTVAYQLLLPSGATLVETALSDANGDLRRAFEAEGSVVSAIPIPPAAMLLLSGFAAAAAVRRRARA